MIKIEHTEVCGWSGAIRGVRNPLNSWHLSDTKFHAVSPPTIGEKDLKLMKTLSKAGNDHAKFLRMINVTVDITAPQFWVAELDTYKIATTRNSCSLQHKGASRPFTIRDFTVQDELYEILDPVKEWQNDCLIYSSCDALDYKLYSVGDRNYKVYRSGKIVACEYTREHEKDDRVRHFKERELIPSKTTSGYYELNLGGRKHHEKWLLHRLVATVWLSDKYFIGAEVNHKDGNKGNNGVDNLEWVTHKENEIHKHKHDLSGRTLHTDYVAWKNSTKFNTSIKRNIIQDYNRGFKQTELAEIYGASQSQVSSIIRNDFCENNSLFELAETWENLILQLNTLRELYLTTGDYNYFRALRQLLPMGYNYRFTWQANYAVLKNIYFSRRTHKLTEWHDFCRWIESLPYSEIITGEERKND